MKVLLVETSGKQSSLFIKDDNNRLEELQNLVGGYIQCLSAGWGVAPNCVPENMNFLLNEDGRHLHLAENKRISELLGEPVYGNVVIVGSPNGSDWSNCPVESI